MSALIKRDRDGNAVNLPQPRSNSAATPAASQTFKRSGVRLFVGLAIAMTADALDVAFPMITLPVDFVTAILISLVFGWRWETIVVMIPEVFPVTAMFPTWVILVFYLGGVKTGKKANG
jgi:hypothetical protein